MKRDQISSKPSGLHARLLLKQIGERFKREFLMVECLQDSGADTMKDFSQRRVMIEIGPQDQKVCQIPDQPGRARTIRLATSVATRMSSCLS